MVRGQSCEGLETAGSREERTYDIENVNQIRVVLVCPSAATRPSPRGRLQVGITLLLLTSKGLEGGDTGSLPKARAGGFGEVCGISSGRQLFNVDVWGHGG